MTAIRLLIIHAVEVRSAMTHVRSAIHLPSIVELSEECCASCTSLKSGTLLLLVIAFCCPRVQAEPITRITVDGNFADWAAVPAYTDPDAAPGVLHHGIPDVHDTDHKQLNDIPGYVDHPDVDILEYKFTHDESNLYGYFKADGIIGRTQTAAQGRAGRYYVIITIDVDNDDSTGYFLHGGGYYPTSGTDRYDMNMEAEFYDGQLNTAHHLSHDALGERELHQDFVKLTNGA